jgi:hypothetical protein
VNISGLRSLADLDAEERLPVLTEEVANLTVVAGEVKNKNSQYSHMINTLYVVDVNLSVQNLF